jgi:8-oxo-dGTP pyrophosphatase MutT (NUDIX family)
MSAAAGRRGGRQQVPRPPGARPGEAAPWAGLAPEGRRITLAEVRARCVDLPIPPPLPAGLPSRAAAVLVPVYEEYGEAHMVLTRRPDTMHNHPGQIAFPGGKVDPALDNSPQDAALREEEIGLDPVRVEVVGALPPLSTVRAQFSIEPFVGLVEGVPVLRPDEHEVAALLTIPISELLDGDVYREEIWPWDGEGSIRSMHFYELVGETVWGATARILTGFLAHVTGHDGPGDWSDPPDAGPLIGAPEGPAG